MEIERADVQSFVLRSGPDLGARYLLLEVEDPAAARAWLAARLDQIGTGERQSPVESFLNVAFTSRGLAAFGLTAEEIATFGHEFQEGMVEEHRSRALGDIAESAPDLWVWGGPGRQGHVLLMIFTKPEDRGRYEDEQISASSSGFKILWDRDKLEVTEHEHFGFRDGISQPIFPGSALAKRYPKQVVRTGEFVLGYTNEHDRHPPTPTVAPERDPGQRLQPERKAAERRDLGRNGSYLVLRQLEQDVASFWQYVERNTGNGSQTAEALAAKFVGRWTDGTPLTLEQEPPPASSPPRSLDDLLEENDFRFLDEDAHGLRCPVGSHIRRANPRDSLPLGDAGKSLRVSQRHRILRRARSYGPFITTPNEPDGKERGLMFACLNADIGRQFEFVQQTWLDAPAFGGLHGERDPLLGSQPNGSGGEMTVPRCPVRQKLTDLPRFVTVRGGGYFFLPAMSALDFLAHLP